MVLPHQELPNLQVVELPEVAQALGLELAGAMIESGDLEQAAMTVQTAAAAAREGARLALGTAAGHIRYHLWLQEWEKGNDNSGGRPRGCIGTP